MNNQHKYTEEDISFIRENIDKMSYLEMANCFSQKYGFNFRHDSISKVAQRNGIKKSIRIYKDRKKNSYKNFYSEEQIEFLKNTFPFCTKWEQLRDLFNQKFNLELTVYEIAGICRRKFGAVMPNSGMFSKDGHPFRLNIGTERIGSGGKICVKVSEDNLPSGSSGNWKQKSRVVYESFFGEIPEGNLIIHLNGNSNDFEISNLYPVSRKVMACLMRNNWYKENSEITLTAIKCAELMCKLKESEE